MVPHIVWHVVLLCVLSCIHDSICVKHSLDEISELEKELEVQDQMSICSEITQCYCIKGTPCGWCEVPDHPQFEGAFVGGPSGPLNHTCPRWIVESKFCHDLVCNTAMSHARRIIHFCIIPVLISCLWLSVSGKTGIDMLSGKDASQIKSTTRFSVGRIQSEFLRPSRTYEAFRKGLAASKNERLPEIFERPYNFKLEDLKRGKTQQGYRFPIIPIVFSKDTAVGASLFHSTSLMLMCAITVGMLRASAAYMDRDGYVFMCNILNEIDVQVDNMQSMVVLLLSFYSLGRIGFWWSVQSEGFNAQGACHNIAMLAGTKKLNIESDWEEAYRLYRWLMVAFFLCYAQIVPKMRITGIPELEACGLLTSSESELLSKAHRAPITMVESWLCDWVERNLEGDEQRECFANVQTFRGSMATMTDWLDQRAPISFESLLFMITYAVCILLPFGPQQFNLADREYIMNNFHIAPVVGVFLKSTFYLSLLRLLRKLQLPFGKHTPETEDDLYPENLMLSTERKLRDYLVSGQFE